MENVLSYYDLEDMLKNTDAYKRLPSNTSQQILMLIRRNWKAYFNALKEYKKAPFRFYAPLRPPKYKKKNGGSLLLFTYNHCRIKNGHLHFPKPVGSDPIKTRIRGNLKQVRILPLGTVYKVEIVYEG